MSEATTGVKWENHSYDVGIIYRGKDFYVCVRKGNWWAYSDSNLVEDHYFLDFATAKRDAERWILEREGRLPAPAPATATDGGWIACSERMPEVGKPVEVITNGSIGTRGWTWDGRPTHWRLRRPVDPHAVAACLFDDRYRPTVEQARAAARHVAGCAECRAKLEEKGGA